MDSESLIGPALAMIELDAIPPGLSVLDTIVKEAPVHIVSSGTVHCGHYLILFSGQVEAVTIAFAKAMNSASCHARDSVLLPHAEDRILPAIMQSVVRRPSVGDTLGMLQTASSPVLLQVVDACLKGATVDLVEMRLADDLGGHSIASVWGETHDVQAALSIAQEVITLRGECSGYLSSIVPNADPEVWRSLEHGTRFFGRGRA